MGNERGKYFSSRHKIQTCSSLGENAVVDDEILFTTVIFILVGSMDSIFSVKKACYAY